MTFQSTDEKPKVSFYYDPKVRGAAQQILLVIGLGLFFWFAASNALQNPQLQKMTSVAFWGNTSGFDVNQTLIPYSALSTYGQAFWVGLLNTLLVAVIGIVLTTFLGFTVGVARLSSNYVIAKLAMIYVEGLRNIPLLLQLLFWYNAVLKPLPNPRDSIALPGGTFLNNRGLILPNPVYAPGSAWVGIALILAIVAAVIFSKWAKKRQALTGQQLPVGLISLGLILGAPIIAYFALGAPISLTYPVLRGFNFVNGLQVFPEFVALLIGLVLYTATYIAEIVRAGILSVPKGQSEAAAALGLRAGPIMQLVTSPQALRVIIPPLTSQYLNLTKNSSLAVAIGYPDLVQVFMGTVLNQTGAAVPVVALTMAVYLFISLVTSIAMNLYNSSKSLVER